MIAYAFSNCLVQHSTQAKKHAVVSRDIFRWKMARKTTKAHPAYLFLFRLKFWCVARPPPLKLAGSQSWTDSFYYPKGGLFLYVLAVEHTWPVQNFPSVRIFSGILSTRIKSKWSFLIKARPASLNCTPSIVKDCLSALKQVLTHSSAEKSVTNRILRLILCVKI